MISTPIPKLQIRHFYEMFDQLKQSFVNKFAIVFSSGWLENLKKKSGGQDKTQNPINFSFF